MFIEVAFQFSLAVYIYFAINSAQSSCKKNKWKCHSEEYYLKESLMSNLCHIIHGKGSSEKGHTCSYGKLTLLKWVLKLKSFYYIDTDEIPGFLLLLKNRIFTACSEHIIFIFHM